MSPRLRSEALVRAASTTLAMAIAIAVAGCGGTPPSSPQPTEPLVTATASGGPSAAPTPGSSPSPSAGTSASAPPPSEASPAGFTCAGTLHLDATATGFEPVPVTDVRVGRHPGYDRIVFEFSGAGTPAFDLASATPPFLADPSDLPVTVNGEAFFKLLLTGATGAETYHGPAAFSPGYPKLTALVNAGDFEGYVTWIAGMTGPACYRVLTLAGPTRLVIDLQAP